MNPQLQRHLPACFKRTTNALRWVGAICGSMFGLILIMALYMAFHAPKLEGAAFIGLGIIAVAVLGSLALFVHANRVDARLRQVFFDAPHTVTRIHAQIIHIGPISQFVIHLYRPKPEKLVGLNVPNRATFDALLPLLAQHFPQAARG